ncbi:MAG: hypothetical protein ACXWWX_05065 [Actinomycetota bacterium]
MPSDRSLLEREMQRLELHPFTLEGFHRRRQRKERNRRIGSAVVALLVAGATIGGLLQAFSSGTVPADDPRGPFLGTWVATDADGSTSTMVIRASGDEGAKIVVHDDLATVCSGTPSTMTGTGQFPIGTELVVPSPAYTCDDGSVPVAQSGPPLEEQLRDLTFVRDPETETLTDTFGLVWGRGGGEDPSPEPATPVGMWPQSSLDEVREAQRLADAGDDHFTWQLQPEMEAHLEDAEIFARFLREELGWEEFRWNPTAGYGAGDPANNNETFSGLVYIRCAPGRTNPLYPDDPGAGTCAPTIDEFRYETVQIDVAQLGRRGSSGIWVVTSSHPGQPFQQMAPPSEAEVTELLDAFLTARVAGEGAQRYANVPEDEIPLLYETTAGAPYERAEFERVRGPEWPNGFMEFRVRLLAEGGETVVEQRFFIDPAATERLRVDFYGDPIDDIPATTENGQAVPDRYSFLDGEVTFAAADPWDHSWGGWDHGPTMTTLIVGDRYQERVAVVADPRPVETGCQQGRTPADAEALARSIRSDPDLEATEPVAVRVGGIPALRMDVVAAAGASVCEVMGTPQVVTPNDHDWFGVGLEHGHRMRLYLLDVPRGSARILAIAIIAPDARFEQVAEAAAPVLDSFEFHVR